MKKIYQVLHNENSIFISIILILFVIGLLDMTSLCLAQSNNWTTKAPMPTGRFWFSCEVVGGKIYAIGGATSANATTLATVEVYEPVSDTWTSKQDMPTCRRSMASSVVDEKIYIVGGDRSFQIGVTNGVRTLEVYDPATDTWTQKTDMPTAREAASASVVNGIIYVMGGVAPGGVFLRDVEAYDPATDTWRTKASMQFARHALGTAVVNGKIYAMGGGRGEKYVEEYDPTTDTWTSKASMLVGNGYFGTGVVNGIIYTMGGGSGPGNPYSRVFAYDPLADEWSEKTAMPTARFGFSAGVVNGKIYAIGGAPGWPPSPLSANEEYTPSMNSLAQIEWQRYPQNPVLNVGSQGNWDAKESRDPAVIFDGSGYHCWYSGWDGASDWHIMIGYASSPDGLTWTKHPTPVLDKGPAGKFDGAAVLGCCVIQVGDTLKMWYQGWSGGFLDNQIGLATSTDGVNWTKYSGNPVLKRGSSGTWNSYGTFFPSVIFDGVTYHIWYAGTAPGKPWEIGYATSPDGITWAEHPDNPVLKAGSPGSWEEGVTFPTVLFGGTTFHMWYTGVNADYTGRIGYANSPDGINWIKADSVNPVLDLVPGTWERNGIELGTVLYNQADSTYRMWYSGLQGDIWRIGYASSTTIPVSVQERTTESNLPIAFELEQNYPNPFNPETSIRYSISKPAHVVLRIMNLLGQEVCTLVNEDKPVGFHEVIWDGKDDLSQRVSSGVYLYRFESKDFIQTRKMILLQ